MYCIEIPPKDLMPHQTWPVKSGSEALFTFSFLNISSTFVISVPRQEGRKPSFAMDMQGCMGEGKLIFTYQLSHFEGCRNS